MDEKGCCSSSSSSSQDTLIFVYNADTGLLNLFKDWTQKIINPSKYDCNLCLLTYGNTGMRKKWHDFVHNLPFNLLFLHRNQFEKNYSNFEEIEYPCLLIEHKNDQTMNILLDNKQINEQKTLEQLIESCNKSIQPFLKE